LTPSLQAILTELSSAQHHLKVSKVSLAWREASANHEPGAEAEADNLRAIIDKETANVARLRADLHKTRDSIAQLQVPRRVWRHAGPVAGTTRPV
jgi:hypothetical protein